DVGAFQLHQRAPLENQPRQVVSERQVLQDLDGRRRLAAALQRRQLQLVEEDRRELLGRVDVERFAGEIVDLRLTNRELLPEVLPLRRQRDAVDAHAGLFDGHQHRDERQLERRVYVDELLHCEQIAEN